ncbi:flagellar biosynthetic protein FliR [Novosphingobium cyanobacteriorum]|uniref:Flagellar biosynthetic protein FliR n=1 Tax=Novosphingobium cyanobacteriorum TaxID=3024215 RepID=A0ABT6CPQ9_9SPHN|nr:flagellar biosynthetic protein FliR [Novosphingobium cyanobacteriorum]MDF8334292.1 flagellar biosynthetic protein FliR [Novosphingobium cyanobacteriorum]
MIAMHFGFGALEAEFWRLLFVMTRIGAALFAAPLFGATTVPSQVRVVSTGAIAVLVCAWTPVAAPPALFSLPGILSIANEVLIGLAMGFVLQFSFSAPIMAAEIIGGGMGMSIATAADPVSGAHSPSLGQYFSVLLTVLFLGLGAHLNWIALLVDSYRTFPPGTVWMSPERLEVLTSFASQMFLTALVIALPVTLLLLMVQLVTGIIGRSAPSLNLFSLGLPAGVLAGFAALIASAPLLTDRLTDLTTTAVEQAGTIVAK